MTSIITLSHSKRIKDPAIVKIMLRLQEDYKFLAEFNKDPDKVMKNAGIKSQEHRKMLKSGDLLTIERLLFECGYR